MVGSRPGLALEDQVRLDGEDAASGWNVEHVDQRRIQVELLAVLTEAGRKAEAQPLVAVGQTEGGVEARVYEPPVALGATVTDGGHDRMLGSVRARAT